MKTLCLALAFGAIVASDVLAKDQLPVDPGVPATRKDYPPGWFPVNLADESHSWKQIRGGNLLLGKATAAPDELDGVKFDRSLHALIAVSGWPFPLIAEHGHVADDVTVAPNRDP